MWDLATCHFPDRQGRCRERFSLGGLPSGEIGLTRKLTSSPFRTSGGFTIDGPGSLTKSPLDNISPKAGPTIVSTKWIMLLPDDIIDALTHIRSSLKVARAINPSAWLSTLWNCKGALHSCKSLMRRTHWDHWLMTVLRTRCDSTKHNVLPGGRDVYDW